MRLLPVILLFCSIISYGQTSPDEEKKNEFTLDGSFLTRGEYRDGGMSTNAEADVSTRASFIFQRVKLRLNYTHDYLTFHFSPQHQTVWGMAGEGVFGLQEGWGQYKLPSGLFFKVGRQELAYDDQRIIGADDWTMLASSHDVLKFGIDGKNHNIHAILAYNQNGIKSYGGNFYLDGSEAYKYMQTLWYHYKADSFPFQGSLLFMNIGVQGGDEKNQKDWYQQLVGTYLKFSPGSFGFSASYYRQMGHEEHGIGLSAWMTSLLAEYKPGDSWKLTAGYDYLSGDDDFSVPSEGMIGLSQHKTLHGFSPLFGAHHKFYGAMDFFYVRTYYGSFTPGLQNAYFNVKYTPIPSLDIVAGYHYFAIATNIENLNKTLGHELETSVKWNFHKSMSLQAGYTFMKGGEAMRQLRRVEEDNSLNWAWLQLVVSPSFLTGKAKDK